MGRWEDRQTDRQTDRQAGRQTDRQSTIENRNIHSHDEIALCLWHFASFVLRHHIASSLYDTESDGTGPISPRAQCAVRLCLVCCFRFRCCLLPFSPRLPHLLTKTSYLAFLPDIHFIGKEMDHLELYST